jgi:hypothetical protein
MWLALECVTSLLRPSTSIPQYTRGGSSYNKDIPGSTRKRHTEGSGVTCLRILTSEIFYVSCSSRDLFFWTRGAVIMTNFIYLDIYLPITQQNNRAVSVKPPVL